MEKYLGIDIGSVATKFVIITHNNEILHKHFTRTEANPLKTIKNGLSIILKDSPDCRYVNGIGITGSGKELIALILNASTVKNEISANAIAVKNLYPKVNTVIEIGGQDSKIIILNNGNIQDFSMNSVCAAGTGSFLEQQANRMGISLETLGSLAIEANQALNIAARCTVFAESDMIYKQQVGYSMENILYGLCLSLTQNYLNSVARGKILKEPICFQGGVAANLGMRKAFEEVLNTNLTIPTHFKYMGAIGVAMITIVDNKSNILSPKDSKSSEKKDLMNLVDSELEVEPRVCEDCENRCNLLKYTRKTQIIGYKGDICGKYSHINGLHQENQVLSSNLPPNSPDISEFESLPTQFNSSKISDMTKMDEQLHPSEIRDEIRQIFREIFGTDEFVNRIDEHLPNIRSILDNVKNKKISQFEFAMQVFQILFKIKDIYV